MEVLAQLEGHVSRGEYVQAIREAERLLRLPDLTPKDRGRLCRLAGSARGQSGDLYGAQKLLELALMHALKARDWDYLGLARAEIGTVLLTIGDIPSAIDALLAYLLDYERYDRAKKSLGDVHYNLGLAHQMRKDYPRAIANYRQAIEWFVLRGHALRAGETHQNLAWAYCLDGQPAEAQRELSIAEPYAPVCGPEFAAEQLVCRALYECISGQIGAAMHLVEEVLAPGRPGCTSTHKGYAAWIAGTISFKLRQYDHTTYYANLATQFALDAPDPGIMSLASTLKAQVAKRNDSTEEAAG